MGSSSKVVRPEEVLESLKNDGTVDALRMKIIAQLKANEDMKKNTMMMVEQSKVLKTPGAEKKTKRELFDALRQELEMGLRRCQRPTSSTTPSCRRIMDRRRRCSSKPTPPTHSTQSTHGPTPPVKQQQSTRY